MRPVLLSLCCALSLLAQKPDEAALHIRGKADPGRIYRTVETLTSPEYEGRLSGSEGYLKAARVVAATLKQYGVQPLVPGYLQRFPSPFTKVYKLALALEGPGRKPLEAKLFKDFAPMLFCGSGKVDTELVFAGYGITSPSLGWDDYQGLDVKGKVVLVLKGAPQGKPGEDWTLLDSHRHRAVNAKRHGAVGLLYTYLPVANPNGDHVPEFPMAMLSEDFTGRILAAADLDLKTLRRILKGRQVASLATPIKVRMETESEVFPNAQACNVLGWILGTDPRLRGEAVVLGAHLDHCGAWPVLMPGADDDASGVAAVMEAARLLASSPIKPRRSIVFLLSGGEEQGLVGAKHFLAHVPAELKTFRFMAFLDVMGAGEGVHVYGLRAEAGREAAFLSLVKDLGLSLRLGGDDQKQVNNGDQFPFQEKGVPAVAIFGTGPHSTYHTNQDSLFRFTPKLTLEAAQLSALLALRKANE